MSIKDEIADIIRLLGEAYDEADNAMVELSDSDPASSDVSSVIQGGYDQAEYAKESIGGAIHYLENLDIPEDDEEEQPTMICGSCGHRG